MPFKWRFFRFSNYFHIGLDVLMVSIMIFRLTDPSSVDQHSSFIIFIFCMALLITNSINNLILFGKYYPEKLPSKGFVVYTKIIFAFSLIPLALVGLVLGVGVEAVFFEPASREGYLQTVEILMIIFLLLTFLTGLHACWYQVVLRKTIRRNFDLGLDKFLTGDNADIFTIS